MSDFEPTPEPTQNPPHPEFQFNTLALLAILTVASLILAAYFGVGRVIGMSTLEILTRGLQQLGYYAPQALVWVAGLVLALHSRRLPPSVSRLIIIAFAGLLLTLLLGSLGQMVLIHFAMSNAGVLSDSIQWWFLAYGVFYSLLNAVWWVLILIALFRGRSNPSVATNQEPYQS